MTECPVCRQAFLYPDEGAVACHMLLYHGSKTFAEHLAAHGGVAHVLNLMLGIKP